MRTNRRRDTEAGLTITSLMDAMTIILCFLLKSYEASDVTVAASDALQLPASSALPTVKKAVQLVLTRSGILVDGERVAEVLVVPGDGGEDSLLLDEEAMRGALVIPLHDRLMDARESAVALGGLLGGEDPTFEGEILVQADRTIPYDMLRRVLFTAGQAGFGKVRFVVVKT